MAKDQGPPAASKDLGGFAPASNDFEAINRKGGGFEGVAPARAMGASGIPPAGEADAAKAIAAVGGLSGNGRSDNTKSAPVTLPTEAGGPLPQGTPTGR